MSFSLSLIMKKMHKLKIVFNLFLCEKMELTQHQFSISFPPVLTGAKLVKTRVLFAGISYKLCKERKFSVYSGLMYNRGLTHNIVRIFT